ncbi:class I SAM-dependent methyltransferase [uncultured Reyranella sp.]|uniref:class I SAM-dependent methyltransferase n=1 Tax=uncultured Reyranella sp. TaxID=735512 RepID=UPI00259C83DC|nr:class I SAM-dependent methyltransferase [uncultured Reyranella sp.]
MARCILCQSSDVEVVLDLGKMALANKFLTKTELEAGEPAYPLRLAHCSSCGHVQLPDRVPPAAMFEDYLYMSSLSETLVNHLHGLAAAVVDWAKLEPNALVLDIGCNDCTLLEGFRKRRMSVLGMDPAVNLAPVAKQKGIEVVNDFFGLESARKLRDRFGPAKAITATNVFPHIPALDDFVAGLDVMLDADGVFVVEAHYLLDLLDQAAFDTIYHEHVSYWSLDAMQKLFNPRGFEVVDCERLPIHHGQLRAFIQRKGVRPASAAVTAQLAQEREYGVPERAPLEKLAAQAHEVRRQLRRTLDELKAKGMKVAGYGAPAKGSTLLTFAGVDAGDLLWIADRSPLKQGRYTPDSHIPVVSTERILQDQPDYLLVLAWNFVDEIVRQQADYRSRGGKFILPVPEVKILQ